MAANKPLVINVDKTFKSVKDVDSFIKVFDNPILSNLVKQSRGSGGSKAKLPTHIKASFSLSA